MLSAVFMTCLIGVVVGVLIAFLWDVFNHWRNRR